MLTAKNVNKTKLIYLFKTNAYEQCRQLFTKINY